LGIYANTQNHRYSAGGFVFHGKGFSIRQQKRHVAPVKANRGGPEYRMNSEDHAGQKLPEKPLHIMFRLQIEVAWFIAEEQSKKWISLLDKQNIKCYI
jgi:hypothetical protein